MEQDFCQTCLGVRKGGVEGPLERRGPEKYPEGHPRNQSKLEMDQPSQRPGKQLLITSSWTCHPEPAVSM